MNWDKDKYFEELPLRHPKANKVWYDYAEEYVNNGAYNGTRYTPMNLRDLYDFFDEQGLIILIDLSTEEGFYGYLVTENNLFIDDSDTDYAKTRTEAEEKAFEKAFEILEKKLPIK